MTLGRRIPLNTLRAFEAAARNGSFVKAGAELNVTPAAVSHRVKDLEAALGVPMFTRFPRGIQLTDAGMRYLAGIAEAFALIDRATATVDQVTVAGPLKVSMPESLAQLWLVPRLGRLAEYAPGLELSIEADSRLSRLNDGAADIAIRYGSGDYAGFETALLFGDAVTVLAPGGATDRRLDNRASAVIEKAVLLEDYGATDVEPWMHWQPWLREAGLDGGYSRGRLRLSNSGLAIRACLANVGICIGRVSLVIDFMAARSLYPLLPWRTTETAHYLVMPPAAVHNPRVQAFRGWLREEIGSYAGRARAAIGFELPGVST